MHQLEYIGNLFSQIALTYFIAYFLLSKNYSSGAPSDTLEDPK